MARISLEAIHLRHDARAIDAAVVEDLSKSMNEIGLLSPIHLRGGDGSYELVSGNHRLHAAIKLGWSDIEAVIDAFDDVDAEIARIDENLCRADLSPTDRATDTARRKALYLQKHPDTEHGANQHTVGRGFANVCDSTIEASNVVRFTTETAKKTKRSERKVQLDVQRGEKVAADVRARIRGTHLDNGLYLDVLKKLPVEEQRTRVDVDLKKPKRKRRSKPATVSVARDPAKPYDEKTINRQFIILMDAWRSAPPEAQARFLAAIGGQITSQPNCEATA